jgi:hypothetical protein
MMHTLILSCALLAAALPQEYRPEILKTPEGIRYVSTGVGFDSRANLPVFSLRLIFASDIGEYVADVTSEIRSQDGTLTLRLHSPGPWLLVDLPPGRYKVVARTNEGKPSSRAVTVVQGKTTSAKLIWKSP